MKLRLLALAALLPLLALGEGPGKTIATSPSVIVPGRPPPAGCATVIPEDANTVFHLYVCGGAILDTKGNVITEVGGSLTRVAKTSLGFPNGKKAEGVTGFSTTKYLSIPNPVLNFSGAFYVSMLLKSSPSTDATIRPAVSASSGSGGGNNSAGYDLNHNGDGVNANSILNYWDPSATVGVNQIWVTTANSTRDQQG